MFILLIEIIQYKLKDKYLYKTFKKRLPLFLIIGRVSGFGFIILLKGQHTDLSFDWQKKESFIYLPTSPGIGFCKFVTKALICLHRCRGTQNDARPVGM